MNEALGELEQLAATNENEKENENERGAARAWLDEVRAAFGCLSEERRQHVQAVRCVGRAKRLFRERGER